MHKKFWKSKLMCKYITLATMKSFRSIGLLLFRIEPRENVFRNSVFSIFPPFFELTKKQQTLLITHMMQWVWVFRSSITFLYLFYSTYFLFDQFSSENGKICVFWPKNENVNFKHFRLFDFILIRQNYSYTYEDLPWRISGRWGHPSGVYSTPNFKEMCCFYPKIVFRLILYFFTK